MKEKYQTTQDIWIYGAEKYQNTFVRAMVMQFNDRQPIELDTEFVTCSDVRFVVTA